MIAVPRPILIGNQTPEPRMNRCGSIGCQVPPDQVLAGVPLCAQHRDELGRELGAVPSSVVYYLTWDDAASIKIGTSSNPHQRFREHAERLGIEVWPLAAHPGGRQEERTQHRRFAHLLLPGEREVFRNAPELDQHLTTIRQAWPGWVRMLDRTSSAARRNRRTR